MAFGAYGAQSPPATAPASGARVSLSMETGDAGGSGTSTAGAGGASARMASGAHGAQSPPATAPASGASVPLSIEAGDAGRSGTSTAGAGVGTGRSVTVTVSPARTAHKTVPLPKSLVELRQSAKQHFDPAGRSARLRLFHQGKELHHPVGLQDIIHDDEIFVRLERDRGIAGHHEDPDRFLTSHRADYIKYPLRARTPEAAGEMLPESPKKKLEGVTSYHHDYVRHPSAPRSARGPDPTFSRHFLAHSADQPHDTEYRNTYGWHKGAPRAVQTADCDSVLSAAARGKPFTARSSYMDEYVKKKGDREGATQALGSDAASTLTDWTRARAFDGVSQYTTSYLKHTDDGRQLSARPLRKPYTKSPFNGDSEYRIEYKEKARQPHHCHLKPEPRQ